ncbi:hypothetical protein JHK87_047795 [Glycine soja]|nr:hypothetical protein JHK87_047795 [Glycine soja]
MVVGYLHSDIQFRGVESESVVAYCSGDITSSSEEMLFECPSGSKVVTISEDMSLDALRKTYMDAIGGCKILLDLFYHQSNYLRDGCVKYECMELKHDVHLFRI